MTPPPRSSRLSRVTPPTGWGAWLQSGVCCPTAQWGRLIFPGTAQNRLQQPAGASWTGRCPPPPRTPGRPTTVLATPSTPLLHAWPFVWAGWTSYGSCWPSACPCPHAVSQIRILFHPSAGHSLTFFFSASFSCAFDGVLHEAEEEVIEPGEQPELLEQRHHHGLFQQARRGAAQTDTHPGERGWVDVSASVVHSPLFTISKSSQWKCR